MKLLAVSLVGLALFGAASAAEDPNTAITSAALAPFRDELLRDAPSLCGDLAHPPTILPSPSQGSSCEQAVQSVFGSTAPPSLAREEILSLHALPSHLKIDGHRATGTFSLSISKPATEHGTLVAAILSLGRYQLSFEEVAGRWLVSSPARLAAVKDCNPKRRGHCTPGPKYLLFELGIALGRTPEELIPTPSAVRRASRLDRREFAAGRAALVESGCLACHRIGDQGNPGPGQNLTHIGAHLSDQQIERALLSPHEPMPSFKNLPPRKLHDLMRFLSLMR